MRHNLGRPYAVKAMKDEKDSILQLTLKEVLTDYDGAVTVPL